LEVLIMAKNTTKIIVDILMVIFMSLSFIRWDGSPVYHSIAGIACTLFFSYTFAYTENGLVL